MPPLNLTCHPQPQRRRTTRLSTFTQTSSTHEGSAYLVLVDRFSGWPIVSQASSGATGLTQVLRETFATFGIPSTLTTDGGPEFTAHATRDLLTSWGVHHRTSSAYHPHANNRAETGVKTVKRLIAGNTDPGGTLKSAFFKALLTYRNCPCPDTRMSLAMCLFGRPIRDLLPTLPTRCSTANPGRYNPAHEADSTKEAPIPGQETLDRAHQGPLPPQTRRQSTGAKPDRPPPNQMGQHRRGGRGHAVPSVSGQDGQ